MTRVVNIKHGDKYDVYIGRPSKWGNPFRITKTQSREQVIERYRIWIMDNEPLRQQLHELRDKTLGCYCKPLACHGDVLVELINDLEKGGAPKAT